MLVLLVRTYGLGHAAAARSPRIVALGLFVVLPLFLWGCMMLGHQNYMAERRYYWPILPLSVFVVYSLASLTSVTTRSRLTSILHISGVAYLTGYIAMSLVAIGLFFVPSERGSDQRARLMGTSSTPHHWPSMKIAYEFSPARRFVMGLLKEQPDTLLLTSQEQWFYADPTVDRSRLFYLRCGQLRSKYLSGPARIVILASDEGEPQALWYAHRRAACFDQLPTLHLLQRFPEERLKVLETHVPAGNRA